MEFIRKTKKIGECACEVFAYEEIIDGQLFRRRYLIQARFTDGNKCVGETSDKPILTGTRDEDYQNTG